MTAEEGAKKEVEASDAGLRLSVNCVFPKLTVNSAARGDAPVVEQTKQLKGSRFTREPFINNHQIPQVHNTQCPGLELEGFLYNMLFASRVVSSYTSNGI